MSEYIQSLRKIVGMRPLIQCGATVLVLEGSQRALMLRRTDNEKWCFPGGAMELGESVEEAARREVLEEAGIHVTDLHLVNIFSGAQVHYRYPNGDEVYNVDVVYCTRQYHGRIRINHESREHAFFPLHDIPEGISPPQRVIVEYLKEHWMDLCR